MIMDLTLLFFWWLVIPGDRGVVQGGDSEIPFFLPDSLQSGDWDEKFSDMKDNRGQALGCATSLEKKLAKDKTRELYKDEFQADL